jgi:hypothetical protein
MLWEAGCEIVILSGRSAEARTETEDWLRRHNVPATDVLLRDFVDDHGNYIPNAEFKVMQMEKWLLDHPNNKPVLMMDDWPGVRDAFADVGVPTLLVQPWYHEVPNSDLIR